MNQKVVIAPAENVEQLVRGYIINGYGQQYSVNHVDVIVFTPDGSNVVVAFT